MTYLETGFTAFEIQGLPLVALGEYHNNRSLHMHMHYYGLLHNALLTAYGILHELRPTKI